MAFLTVLLAASTASAQSEVQITSRLARIDRGEPPQITDASRLYERARPHEGSFEGTLLCKINVARNRRYDGAMPRGPVSRNFGAPDLRVRMRLPGNAGGSIVGPEDRYSTTVSIPGVTLRRGRRVGVHADDRDPFRDDVIGDAVAVYQNALPLQLPGMNLDAECRALDPGVATQRLPRIFQRADREIGRAGTADVDLEADRIEGPRPALNRATYHLYDAAALVGWDHEGVSERRQRIEAAQRAFDDALRQAVSTLQGTLADVGVGVAVDGTPFEARVSEVQCDYRSLEPLRTAAGFEAPRTCGIRLEVASERSAPFRVTSRTLSANGRLGRGEVVLIERDDGYARYLGERLPAGQLHALWVLVDDRHPQLLRLKARGRTTFLRAR